MYKIVKRSHANLDKVSTEIIEVLREFHTFSGYEFPFDPEYAKTMLIRVGNDPNGLVLTLDTETGETVGCIVAISAEHHMSPVKVATELVWWVKPEHRGRHSLDLLTMVEYWAKELQGCQYVCMISLESNDVGKIYQKRGYTLKEHAYMKEL